LKLVAGFPGDVDVSVRYTLISGSELRTHMEARPLSRSTPISLAQHSYFNLAGHASGKDVLEHRLCLGSSSYTPVNDNQIPTGEVTPVQGTPFDFREEATIGSRIREVPGGYDHNYVLTGSNFASSAALGDEHGGDKAMGTLHLAARLWEPSSKRAMEVFTTAPGVQFYTGNFLNDVIGKGGAVYGIHSGLCLETQQFPNAINEPNFPSVVVRPGETYRHVMVHRFYTLQ
jgi:aldose 1-epimerase